MGLRQPVAENALHRKGHQPFHRTIGDLLKERAEENLGAAFLHDDLVQLSKGRHIRNGV